MALAWFQGLFQKPAIQTAPATIENKIVIGEALQESLHKPGTADPTVGYRRLTRSDDRRDLDPVRWEWQLQLANWLWATHPVAKKCLKNHKNFICGHGFTVRATCEDSSKRAIFQSLLDKHWEINEWDTQLSKRVETLAVEGEWTYYAGSPDPVTGHVQLCKVLPENIRDIAVCRYNQERLDEVILHNELHVDGQIGKLSKLKIVHRDWRTGRYEGDTIHLGINRLSGQCRGFSDLLVVADHLDLFDNTLFTEAERIGIQRSMVWDVLINNKDDEYVRARRMQLQMEGPPRAGAVNVHGPDETWSAVTPTLNVGESIEYLDLLKTLVCAGLDNPIHWLSEGGDVNKATAGEMGGPAFAFIRERQREIIEFMNLCIGYQIQCWIDAGSLSSEFTEDDLKFEIQTRDPEKAQYQAIGAMLQALGQSLLIAQNSGWLSRQEAARAFRAAATDTGLGEFAGIPDTATLEESIAQLGTVYSN
ncbi:MAG: hypothetical protein E6Q97_08860 [Desulfurellales bacterium]|nr:MAG: hypothetical protein E6Q97_08860 [Desulfurellales bacterium]